MSTVYRRIVKSGGRPRQMLLATTITQASNHVVSFKGRWWRQEEVTGFVIGFHQLMVDSVAAADISDKKKKRRKLPELGMLVHTCNPIPRSWTQEDECKICLSYMRLV